MPDTDLPVSPYTVQLPRRDLHRMLRVARILFRLSQHPGYRQEVYARVPANAQFDPRHDAVMMGYDFHLTDAGPRLIEVNTNAGGSYLALQSESAPARQRFFTRAIQTFFDDYARYGAGTLRNLVILDELPGEQFLFPEMEAFARAFAAEGLETRILDPSELVADARGVFNAGIRCDMLYNRHCDFYLESPAMAGVREAYLAAAVCLSPNPHSYGLLADKRRMLLWCDPERLRAWGLTERERTTLALGIPDCRMLADVDPDVMWEERKDWVFKPVALFGSRGVLTGDKITRKRFHGLEPESTLCQRLVEPSLHAYPDGREFKADFRLFVYRDRLLGVAARLYRGQVTNMRTEGGGFARVEIV